MRKILGLVFVLALFASAAPVAAGDPPVDTYEGPFASTVVTGLDLPESVTVGLMECDFVKRVWHPDGTAHETQQCALTGTFFTAYFDGRIELCEDCTAPKPAFVDLAAPPCIWFSDYVWYSSGEVDEELADRFRATVTPSGNVSVTSYYEGGCDSG